MRPCTCPADTLPCSARSQPLFAAVLRDRLPRALLQQTLFGERLTSTALASHGVVSLSPPSDTGLMTTVNQLATKIGAKAATGVWGEIRSEIWRDIVVIGDKAQHALGHGARVQSPARPAGRSHPEGQALRPWVCCTCTIVVDALPPVRTIRGEHHCWTVTAGQWELVGGCGERPSNRLRRASPPP
jgi:hypothetical protein